LFEVGILIASFYHKKEEENDDIETKDIS